MVQVAVSTSVKVEGGPSLPPLGLTFEPNSYTLNFSALAKAGEPADADTVPLPDGNMVLLAVTVNTPTEVEVQLMEGKIAKVNGSLLIANEDVLNDLLGRVTDRELKLTNKGTAPVTVEILTCRTRGSTVAPSKAH